MLLSMPDCSKLSEESLQRFIGCVEAACTCTGPIEACRSLLAEAEDAHKVCTLKSAVSHASVILHLMQTVSCRQ